MPPETTKKVKSTTKGVNDNDIYTALLGLTFLVMAATAVTVCLRALDLFGSIFKLTYGA